MELRRFLELARKFSDLGGAVQEQLEAVAEDCSPNTMGEQNSNALVMVAEFLARAWDVEDAEDLQTEIEEYLAHHGENEDDEEEQEA